MWRLFTIALVVSLAAAGADTARLTGLVRSSGLPIPGATITASQGARKVVTATDEAGRYEFDQLTPGAWSIEVDMVGFARLRREVTLTGDALNLDCDLEFRAVPATGALPRRNGYQNMALNQMVENAVLAAATSGEGPAQTEAANANEAFLVNGSLNNGLQQAQQEAELAARRAEFGFGPGLGGFAQDGQAVPGAPAGFGGVAGQRGPGGPGGFGGPGMGGGGPMRGGGFGGRGPGGFAGRRGPGERPFDRNAVFGNRSGRGRGGVRGMAFFSLDNSALDARPFSLTGQTVDKSSYAQSRFGAVMGGALRVPKLHSDRTFFFLSYFGTRARTSRSFVDTLPTAAERSGDFSQALAAGAAPIYDPLTGQPFAGNQIPANRINTAARGLLSFIPLPNQPGLVQNYQFVTSAAANSDNFGARLNHTLSQKNRFDFHANLQRRNSVNPQLYGFRDSGDGAGVTAVLGWTHNLSARTINSLRFNFSRNSSETVPFFAYGENVAAALGITGVSQEPINYGPPNLSFTNFGGLTDASPVLTRNQTAGITEGITLVRGSHTITAGGEFRRMQLNTRTDQNARGTFLFSGLATSVFDVHGQPVPGTGFDFADFLLGLPQSSSVRFGDTSTYFRSSVWDGYVADDWRPRPNLSLNLGLRYEYFTPFTEKYGHIANLDIAPGFTGVAVVVPGGAGPYTGPFPSGLINPDKNNVSPRLGLAWRPFAKKQLQVRAGYGIYYNGSIYSQFPSQLAAQPPFASTASLVTSVDRQLTIENGFALSPAQTVSNTFAVDRNYRVGYAQSWNVAIQQNLPHSFIAEVGYLGTKGTRLDIDSMPNRAAPGSPLTAEQRRRIGNAVGFIFDTSDGNSIYHALQARLVRRFHRGVSMNALYTFSKSIDNASTIGGGAMVVAQDNTNLAAERGLSSFDRRHTLRLNYILTSPAGDSAHRLLKDWTLSGGLTLSSGIPLTARVLGNQSDTGGTGSVGSGRADATGEPIDSGTGFFNLGAFTLPPAARYGNAGRNTIPGPGQVSLNLSFGRSFSLDDRRRLEVRADSSNFLNHVSYTSLATVVNATNFGLPTAAASMRTITFTTRLRF